MLLQRHAQFKETMEIDDLIKHWENVLLKRYCASDATHPFFDIVTEAVEILANIYAEYAHGGLSDANFDVELRNFGSYTYSQRLGEMLLWHSLQQAGFSLKSKNPGPDFLAEKDGEKIWIELITPEPGDDGKIEEKFEESDPLNPNQEDSLYLSEKTLNRVIKAIETKQKKYLGYLKKNTIDEKKPCVIAVNDSLLCPDVFYYGVTHNADNGVSGYPLVAEAVLGTGRPYYSPTLNSVLWPLIETFRERAPKPDSENSASLSVSGFLDKSLIHIAAIMQMTLREDYGIAMAIRHKDCAAARKLVLLRPIIVYNDQSTVPLLPNLFDAKVFNSSAYEVLREK